jgi:hypothetical protein
MALNRNVIGVLGGTIAAGILWMRWRRNHRRRSTISRLRGVGAGTMLVITGVATRWKSVRGLSRRVGMGLIGKSLAIR